MDETDIIHGWAKFMIEHGYDRERLIDEMERLYRSTPDDSVIEDALLAGLDSLVGWCSPGAKI